MPGRRAEVGETDYSNEENCPGVSMNVKRSSTRPPMPPPTMRTVIVDGEHVLEYFIQYSFYASIHIHASLPQK
jgi:hypothetical protein